MRASHRLNTRPKKQPEPTYQECPWYYRKLNSESLTQLELLRLVQEDPEFAGYLVAQNYTDMGACFGLLLYCRNLEKYDAYLEGYRNGRSSLRYNPRQFGHLYRTDPPQTTSNSLLEGQDEAESH